jgi:hypothetical protein
MQMPDMHDRIRIRGHHKSRQFAASKLWPRVIGDLFADIAAFGTERQTLRPPARAGGPGSQPAGLTARAQITIS